MITVFIASFSLLLIINLVQLRYTKPGSDHFIHFAYINSIRQNRGRFIKSVQAFLNPEDFPDPQLYHWVLAKLPPYILEKYFRYLGMIINVLSLVTFLVFAQMLYPYLQLKLPIEDYLLKSSILFVLTPFGYFTWNAKNVGLSARGFGLLFGNCFVYSLTLFLYSNSYFFLAIALSSAYIVLMSSQFAFQMVFFFSILTAILFKQSEIALIPFASVIIFFLTFPRWAIVFFKRQWEYKKVYYSILAERFVLKVRYSIWLDFIYDFWRDWGKKGVIRAIQYIYRNPVVEVILGFPSLLVFVLFYLIFPNKVDDGSLSILILLITVSLIIFLLTSFRSTRFLGEPQRYVEFTFPLMTFLPLSIDSKYVLILIGLYSILLIGLETIGIRTISRKQAGGLTEHEKKIELLNHFIQLSKNHTNVRIASNKIDVLKYFAADKFKILNVNVTSEITGGFHFNEIFPESYGDIDMKALIKLIDAYDINWVIIESTDEAPRFFEEAKGQSFVLVEKVHHYTIYRRC